MSVGGLVGWHYCLETNFLVLVRDLLCRVLHCNTQHRYSSCHNHLGVYSFQINLLPSQLMRMSVPTLWAVFSSDHTQRCFYDIIARLLKGLQVVTFLAHCFSTAGTVTDQWG